MVPSETLSCSRQFGHLKPGLLLENADNHLAAFIGSQVFQVLASFRAAQPTRRAQSTLLSNFTRCLQYSIGKFDFF